MEMNSQKIDRIISRADTLAKAGKSTEALKEYQRAATYFEARGRGKDALQVLRKMAKLIPDAIDIRMRLAELLIKDGLRDEALEEFRGIISEVKIMKDGELAQVVYQKMKELDLSFT